WTIRRRDSEVSGGGIVLSRNPGGEKIATKRHKITKTFCEFCAFLWLNFFVASMTKKYVIETYDLTKRYGTFDAVSNLNMRIGAGRITGFLGRNGAGKSSTIKMLLGIIRPSQGTGVVLGHDIEDAWEGRESRRRVAYVAEDKQTYAYMTVGQM